MLEIREPRPDEQARWLRLRQRLWPHAAGPALALDQEAILSDPERNGVIVAARPDGELVGFVEVSLREQAEGCSTRPVGYLEGWYVEPEHRRSGVGRRLVEAAEVWAFGRGCQEMASDALLENTLGDLAHRALGFAEVERVVLFRKPLGGRARTREPVPGGQPG
jgi:aminoglycoside 6'-N-acetyltransferase I